ncbi:MAG: uncharacterized protein QOD07_2017 [Frankiaceae bacterium]|nr:uncharacterized protein [Frankiaceae bacterium]
MANTLWHSLTDAGGMLWETLWALVLGFGLSGAVQAFVSRARMQRALGDSSPASLARAGFFGAVSSSCSYAATALAKTLFVRGADFTAAQAFAFASTNLVVELGIVLWLLIGWQFALAELVGGALMVALIGLVLPRVVRPAETAAARATLTAADGQHGADGREETSRDPRTLAGWADAAAYTVGDLTMLRRELVIGFLVAGLLDTAVPLSFWRSLFATGHGFWSAVENAVLGPFLAILSFVCSIGNVPLAAALWSGGIGFGGVVAFVFADLITLPLLLIYRRYYGTRITAKLLAVFWATMSVAGLAVEGLFHVAGIAPGSTSRLHKHVGDVTVGWNATTVLDVVSLVVLAGIVVLYRQRERLGAGANLAVDPVCGMTVDTTHPGAVLVQSDGTTTYFCSDHCKHRYASTVS